MGYLGTKPANAAVTSEQIADGAVSTADIAANAVTTAKIADANVTQDKLGAGVAGTGPAFFAATAYNITLTNNSTTVATTYSGTSFDTAYAFNTSTGKFQPTIAGYYQINVIADFGNNGIGSCSAVSGIILKNGATVVGSGASVSGASFAGYLTSSIVYLNGSTDYLQAGIFQNTGSSVSFARAIFNGALVRAA